MKCVICENGMRHLARDLFICDDCGLVSSDVPADVSIYDKSYMIKYQRYSRSLTGSRIQRLRHDTLKKHIEHGTLLDFGCGTGNFLDYCRSDGFFPIGFDINPYDKFCDVSVLFQEYDIVTFWDCLEHLSNPRTVINGLKAKYVFACTPSLDDFGMPLACIPRYWRHYYPGEHVHCFSQKSLGLLLKICGYEVIETHYLESELRKSGGDKNILTMGGRREDG